MILFRILTSTKIEDTLVQLQGGTRVSRLWKVHLEI